MITKENFNRIIKEINDEGDEVTKLAGWVYMLPIKINREIKLDINSIYPDVNEGSRAKRLLNNLYGKPSSQNKI